MSMRVGLQWGLAVAAGLVLSGCSLTRSEPDPMVVKTTVLDNRVGVLETRAEAMLELQRQIDTLDKQLRDVRGQIEQLSHDRDNAKAQNRDLYADLEKRTSALETRVQAASVASAAVVVLDRDAYAAALDRLKGRDYPGAEKSFVDMIAKYPDSALADNAKYWLGETYYVEKRYEEALSAFQRVIHDHPDSRKVPDALLKAGYSVYELKRYKDSKEFLNRLLKQYPDSNAATEARERLRHMAAEGH